MVVRALFAVCVAGCFHPDPAAGGPCSPSGDCPGSLQCIGGVCVAGGEAGVDACAVTSCVADQVTDCTGTHTCPFGCASAGAPHCLALVPSNGITTGLLAGATAVVDQPDLEFDTGTGQIQDGNDVVIRSAGAGPIAGIGFTVIDGMGVFTAQRFAIDANSTWTAQGANALVLFAADTVVIDGELDAGAQQKVAGPGGSNGGVGEPPPTACFGNDGRYKMSNSTGAGAGGGGGETAGGAGAATVADASGATSGGVGGTTCAVPSAIPLRGGNGGGAGGTENLVIRGGAGGGAGGAVAVVAMASVTVTGVIGAPGAGGQTIGGGSGGGGGGGGGAVFVESPLVTIAGALTANGGGGGASTNLALTPNYGQRGHLADAVAATGGPAGGSGGAAGHPATAGTTTTGGGGGGGAAGVLAIKSIMSSLTGAVFSPAVSSSTATLE